MPAAAGAVSAQRPQEQEVAAVREHPRVLGWLGTSSLAMGGSNPSLFLIGALVLSQGTAAVPLLAIGLLLSWAAAPGWLELVLMWPKCRCCERYAVGVARVGRTAIRGALDDDLGPPLSR